MFVRSLACLALLALLLTGSGCGGTTPPPPGPGPIVELKTDSKQPDVKTDPKKTEVKPPPDVKPTPTLAELLKEPRAELAKQSEVTLARLELQERNRREANRPFRFYSYDRFPIVLPVWRQAKFSADAGFSLPPYHAHGKQDAVLALHLARWGDLEAARKLTDPKEADTLKQIDTLKLEGDFPLEWTRLAALRLHEESWKLATGEAEGLTELVKLHKELREILGPKAQASLLGSDLLGRGRGLLLQVARAADKDKHAALLAGLPEAGKNWGKVALPGDHLPLGSKGAGWFGAEAKGLAVRAAQVPRFLDLLSVPLSEEGVTDVLGLFAGEALQQIVLVYRPNLDSGLLRMESLEVFLAEEARGGTGPRYLLGQTRPTNCVVTPFPGHHHLGALVLLTSQASKAQPVELPRDLGTVHLSRGFETNRLRFVPEQLSDSPRVADLERLQALAIPRLPLPLASASLVRAFPHDLLVRLEVTYNRPERGKLSLGEVIGVLGEKLGPLQSVEVFKDKAVALVWQDDRTFWTLGLPAEREEVPQLAVGSVRKDNSPETLVTAVKQATEFERQGRKDRFKSGQLWARLPRELEKVKLGQSRVEVQKALANLEPQLQRDENEQLLTVLTGAAVEGAYQPREILARFNKQDKVIEVRIRYTTGKDVKNGGTRVLLNELKKQYGTVASPSGPTPTPPIRYPWSDDATLLDALVSSAGLELRLRDRPLEQEAGVVLPPLQLLSRGPAKCQLGNYKNELLKVWNVTKPTTAGDALQLNVKSGPHDVLLVWFDKDNRAVKVQARHTDAKPTDATSAGQAALTAWGREMRNFGWAWEQALDKGVLQSCGNRDDFTHVQTFGKEQGGTWRVYTQWESLRFPEAKE